MGDGKKIAPDHPLFKTRVIIKSKGKFEELCDISRISEDLKTMILFFGSTVIPYYTKNTSAGYHYYEDIGAVIIGQISRKEMEHLTVA